MILQDTIVAIATPPGRGSIGVVRLSGPDALAIGERITHNSLKPRHAHYGTLFDDQNQSIDQAISLYFKAPHSFTGEDIVELQCHGGPVVLDMLIAQCTRLGARIANPGEFSERAFLNDKIDLAQAEAIADLIDAASEQAARSAVSTLQGEFSNRINQIVEQLTALRIYTEAAIDFPEEEIDFLNDGHVLTSLTTIKEDIDNLLANATQGALLSEGFNLVIIGKPNAGKSSLLNRLAGRERAIVTDIAGTTRDLIEERIQIDGLPINLIDTAGIREARDQVEQEGIRRSREQLELADAVILLLDATDTISAKDQWAQFTDKPFDAADILIVYNKIDLAPPNQPLPNSYAISAIQGDGVQQLKQQIKKRAGFAPGNEQGFTARRRHLQAIEQAKALIDTGYDQLVHAGAGELLAEDLRLAQDSLGEITGKLSADDLLGKIFSSFCIGK